MVRISATQRVKGQHFTASCDARPRREADDALFAFEEKLEFESPDHLVFGHRVFIGDNPPADDQISLLQLNCEEPLNLMYGDRGQIPLFGAPERQPNAV
jgi:hypothetical protein